MKAYIGNVDWADEGNVFFFSIIDDEKYKALKELFDTFNELHIIDKDELYWGTNEFFIFDADDYQKFINNAKDITKEELVIFQKFDVSGLDIYSRIEKILYEDTLCCEEEVLDKLKPTLLKIYGPEDWIIKLKENDA